MLFYDGQVSVGTAGSIVFPGNEFSSLLDGRVLLVMHNCLNILPAIQADPGLGCLLLERISRIEVVEEERAQTSSRVVLMPKCPQCIPKLK